MKRLDISTNKLERLKNELEAEQKKGTEEFNRIPFGQPNIIGRPDIYKHVKRHHAKQRKLMEQIEQQEMRVDKLEKIESFKEENELLKDVHVVGKSAWATVGAKTSVNNIAYFEDKLKKLEEQNILNKEYNKKRKTGERKAKTYGADITKLRHKIEYLKAMEEKAVSSENIMTEKTKELIENGSVRQYKKKPIYYFVDGLRKVALEIDEQGNFKISGRYPAWSEQDKQFVKELLGE